MSDGTRIVGSVRCPSCGENVGIDVPFESESRLGPLRKHYWLANELGRHLDANEGNGSFGDAERSTVVRLLALFVAAARPVVPSGKPGQENAK